jgi:hypothetical protein
MWEPSLLTSTGQLEALRLVSEWWASPRRSRRPEGPRRAGSGGRRPVADTLVLPPGYTPAHLDERLAEVS